MIKVASILLSSAQASPSSLEEHLSIYQYAKNYALLEFDYTFSKAPSTALGEEPGWYEGLYPS